MKYPQLILCLVLLGGLASTPVAAGTASMLGWQNQAASWAPSVIASKASYSEGNVVPIRIVATQAAGTVHTLRFKYDFSSGGVAHFFDYLQSPGASEPGVQVLGGVVLPVAQQTSASWPIPADTTLAFAGRPVAQPAGSVITYNVARLTFGTSYSLEAGAKVLTVTYTVAGAAGSGNRTVVLAVGCHLASAADWGVGGGASLLPGASRKAYACLDSDPALNVSVNPDVVAASTDLALSAVGPASVCPGSTASYQFTLRNQGSSAAKTVVASFSIPTGTSLLSVTATAGTVAGTGPVTVSIPSLAAGASVGFTLSLGLGGAAPSTIAPAASVSSQTQDPVPSNNSVSVSTSTLDLVPPAFVTSPGDLVVGTDPGLAGARVQFSAVATDDCDPSVLISFSVAPGSLFPVGSTPVTVSAKDRSGNSVERAFTVTVQDTEPPRITVPSDVTVDLADGQCEFAADYLGSPATAADNADGVLTVSYSPAPGTPLAPGDHLVTVSAADRAGNSATAHFNLRVRDNPNVSWPAARLLPLTEAAPGLLQASFSQCLNDFDQSRWYRFPVKPGSRVITILGGLPQDYDLVLFKDIQQTYSDLTSQSGDLSLLGAEFAADAFSPAAFSADAFSPAAFSPAAFSPAAFSPAAFSPAAFSPAAFSPAAFSPAAFSPDAFSPAAFSPAAFSPAAFSPAAFSPAAFSPAAFSPAAFSPAAFSPAAFSDAQIRSVIGVSAFDGLANEGIVADTWTSTGEFYLRVRGRNGVFQAGARFDLSVFVLAGACESVELVPPQGTGVGPAPEAAAYRTLVLTDSSRLHDDGSALALADSLAVFAARPEVRARILDLAAYPQVAWLNAQADAHYDCPVAKNLVAAAIRDIISQWRAVNPIENIVLLGGDGVVPFIRYPDQALLGPERNYVPPVRDLTATQAGLKLNYVLGQDAYGATCEVKMKLASLPLPEVPVGRLVESPSEILSLLNAYLETPSGVLPTPSSALVTGYDFLSDAATAVRTELEAGLGAPVESLIDAATVAPANGWSADQLRSLLFSARHDLIFLAGHFSAFSALAADYRTAIFSQELAATTADFKNSILFSAGCHSGYSVPDQDGIPFVTPQPDWAQAAARRGATLVAGTGYQYGDTDFIEYSERLYLLFARELRRGSGPVSVGQALLRAKRHYLATTPVLRGIHQKAFLESTLFGLPMLSLDMAGGRLPSDTDPSRVAVPSLVAGNPGLLLGLQRADISIVPSITSHSVTLQDVESGGIVTASYLEGADGVLVNPAEPVLPLEVANVSVPNTTLRGVGWRGGSYTDTPNVIPLTGAATTEVRGIHSTFLTDVFYPVQLWSVNYFDTACGAMAATTRLQVWPAQFLSDNSPDPRGTRRQHDRLDFRLYYSNNHESYALNDGSGQIIPALAAPPAISGVFGGMTGNTVTFQTYVTASPAAGIQEVWVTYTSTQGAFHGTWSSLDLTQDPADSTLWNGQLDLAGVAVLPADFRFVVQAVSGTGLVTLSTRQGAYHSLDGFDGWNPATAAATQVHLIGAPTQAAFGDKVTFTASWAAATGESPAFRTLVFALGDQQVVARTDAAGVATASLNVQSVPGSYELKVSFQGGAALMPSHDASTFLITPAATTLQLDPPGPTVQVGGSRSVSALLTDTHGPLVERTVLFQLTGPSTIVRAVVTDFAGRADLGLVPSGTYALAVYFGERVTLPDGVSVVDMTDARYLGAHSNASLGVDREAPTLSSLSVDTPVLTPADHRMVSVTILPSFLDPSGPTTSRLVRVTSSDPESGTGLYDLAPDTLITGPLTASLRAEVVRAGASRVYTLWVETSDLFGNLRSDSVSVSVSSPRADDDDSH